MEKMLQFGPKDDVISKKKGLHQNQQKKVISKKKDLLASLADFSVSFRWASSRAHVPSAWPAETNGLPAAHGPPKVHGPWDHCPPLSTLSSALPGNH